MERAQMSIDRWMDKEDVVYINNGVLAPKNKIVPFSMMWMKLEWNIMLSERSHSEKDNYHVISLIYGIKETKQMNVGERGEK